MTEEYAESKEQLPPLPESPHVVITPVPNNRLSPPRQSDYTPTRLPQPPVQSITHAGPPTTNFNFKPVSKPPGAGEMQSGWYYYCPPNQPAPNLPPPPQAQLEVAPTETPEQIQEREEALAKRQKIFKGVGTAVGVVALFIVLLLLYFWWSGHTDYWWENDYDN